MVSEQERIRSGMPEQFSDFENELYTQRTMAGKTRKINYKVKACQMIEPENWIRVEGHMSRSFQEKFLKPHKG